MSASTPYIYPTTTSNRVIPTNNNLNTNNANIITKPSYQYPNQQRSSIMLNSNINNSNDNINNNIKSTINLNTNIDNNNFDTNETKSKFSYS